MSLQIRLNALIAAVGADIKALQARKPTILSRLTQAVPLSETEESSNAVEWRAGGPGGAFIAKVAALNPIENSVIMDRSELRARVKNRAGTIVSERVILDSNGNSGLLPRIAIGGLPQNDLIDGQEFCYLPDPSDSGGWGDIVWVFKYRASDNKWYCIQGQPMTFGPNDATDLSTTGSFLSPSGVPSTFTCPWAGDYLITHSHSCWNTANNVQMDAGMRFNGGQPNSQKLAMAWCPVANTSQPTATVRHIYKGLAAGTTINIGIRTSGGTAKLRNLWYDIIPVRVNT
jgi:hypothetical protein